MRYLDNGDENPDFILNQPDYRSSSILLAGDNFGCGSSREHAPWALLDFGIKCIIAPSFADIFFNNCFKNGILPIVLSQNTVNKLMQDSDKLRGQNFIIDLPQQVVVSPSGDKYSFDIDSGRKTCLLDGLDDIALTLKDGDNIKQFEDIDRLKRPWTHFISKAA